MPSLYIKEDTDGYFRVYLEYGVLTTHKLHSEKLSKINAEKLTEEIKHQFGMDCLIDKSLKRQVGVND